jgi:hypothetical protein
VRSLADVAQRAGFGSSSEFEGDRSDDDGIFQLTSACELGKLKSLEQLDTMLGERQSSAFEFFNAVVDGRDYAIYGSPAHYAAMIVIGSDTNLNAKEVARTIGWNQTYAAKVHNAGQLFLSASKEVKRGT